MTKLRKEIEHAINCNSAENGSDTMKSWACETEPSDITGTCECGGTRLPPVRSDDLLDACIQELERLQSNVCEEDYDSIQRILDRASNVCNNR